MTFGGHLRAVAKLGLPLVLSNVAMFAIHMTDTIMLGWYDVKALAASTIAGTMMFVVFIVGAGFGQAVTPMVAAAAEEGDEVRVRRVTRMGIWLSIIYGAVVMIPFFWAEDILIAMGQDAEVSALAHVYLQIVLFQMIPWLLVMTMKSFLAALEHTAIILWGTLVMAPINALINYALIFGNWGFPEMGIQGAAIASLIVTVVTCIIMFAYPLIVLPQYRLLQNLWRSDAEILGQVYRLGWPIGLTSLAEGGLFSASAVMMGWIGALPLAAHGVAIQLASLTFMFHIGMSQAATVRAGRALGRNDELGLRRGGIAAIGLSMAFAVFTMGLFLIVPELLISGFIDPDDPARDAIMTIGVALLAMAALFQIVDAVQVMALGLLRGVHSVINYIPKVKKLRHVIRVDVEVCDVFSGT